MTNKNPTPGNDTGLPTYEVETADAIKARIAQWCDWFSLDAPKVRTRLGSVYLTDQLANWMDESSASFDWIFCGNPKGMAVVFHQAMEANKQAIPAIQAFDETEKKMMLAALLLIAQNEVTLEDSMGAFKSAVEERRRSA